MRDSSTDNSNIKYYDCTTDKTDQSLSSEQRLENCLSLCKNALALALDLTTHPNPSITHLKGFALRMVIDDNYLSFEQQLVVQLGKKKHDVVVWDGDDFGDESFTRALLSIHERLPHIRFCAFLRNSNREKRDGGTGFDAAWKNQKDFSIPCLLVDDDVTEAGYANLGNLALQATGAKHVYCLGGGVCVKDEVEMAENMGLGVGFVLFDAVRRVAGGDGEVEHSPLMERSTWVEGGMWRVN